MDTSLTKTVVAAGIGGLAAGAALHYLYTLHAEKQKRSTGLTDAKLNSTDVSFRYSSLDSADPYEVIPVLLAVVGFLNQMMGIVDFEDAQQERRAARWHSAPPARTDRLCSHGGSRTKKTLY